MASPQQQQILRENVTLPAETAAPKTSGQMCKLTARNINFYYGALRKTPYRWVNIRRLCELLLPRNTVTEIKYFTARVRSRPSDPDAPNTSRRFPESAPAGRNTFSASKAPSQTAPVPTSSSFPPCSLGHERRLKRLFSVPSGYLHIIHIFPCQMTLIISYEIFVDV